VGIVAIFMAFLTLPAPAQGTTLVVIAITCIFLIFIFARKAIGLWRLAILFFIIWTIWASIISGFTDYHVPFFVENFGLVTDGVIYAKSDIGLALLIIKYILWFIAYFLYFLICFRKRYYLISLVIIFISIFIFYVSVPFLYIPNFIYVKVLGIDWLQPKTVAGDIVYFLGIFSLFFIFTSFYLKNLILVIRIIFYKIRSLVRSL